jgi:lysozyme
LLWGAYHYGTRQYPGDQQAAAFLAAAQPGPATLMALDFEPNTRHPSNTMTLNQAEAFVQAVYQATGRLPLVYTHPVWANGGTYAGLSLGEAVAPHSMLARCDLWLADYDFEPELPWAWAGRGWRFWQYAGNDDADNAAYGSAPRSVAGVDHCDRNLFSGDVAALYRYWDPNAHTS